MTNLGTFDITIYALVKERLEQAVAHEIAKLEASGDVRPHDGFQMKVNAHQGANGVAISIDVGAVKKP